MHGQITREHKLVWLQMDTIVILVFFWSVHLISLCLSVVCCSSQLCLFTARSKISVVRQFAMYVQPFPAPHQSMVKTKVGLIRTNKLVRLRNYPHHLLVRTRNYPHHLLVRTRNYPHQLYCMHTWATQHECQRLEGQSQGPESLQGEVWVLVLLVLSFLVPITSNSPS